MQDILSRLEASRKELLDLSLHNPLLNYRPLSSRGVTMSEERAAEVYDLLVREAKSLAFAPQKDPKEQANQPNVVVENETENGVKYRDSVLQTPETETALQSRLLNTYYTDEQVLYE